MVELKFQDCYYVLSVAFKAAYGNNGKFVKEDVHTRGQFENSLESLGERVHFQGTCLFSCKTGFLLSAMTTNN